MAAIIEADRSNSSSSETESDEESVKEIQPRVREIVLGNKEEPVRPRNLE